MIKKTNTFALTYCIIALILTSACVNTNRDYPVKNYYIIDITRKTEPKDIKIKSVLEVDKFVSPSIKSGKEFIYRFPNDEYKSDFYNEFFINPNDLIRDETSEWIAKSGLFKAVIDSNTNFSSDLILEGNIDELYADFSSDVIKAVLSMQLFLTENTRRKTSPLFHKNYKREIITESRAPKDLIVGWNKALEEILSEFETDVSLHKMK